MTTRTLIKGGTVLSMDPLVGDARPADVLVEDSTIVAVAADIDDSGCQVIDASEMVVMPGLIDPHRHLWYQGFRGCATDATMVDMVSVLWPRLAAHITARDLYQFTRAGIVAALDNGITTVFDWCHAINTPEHAHEAIRAHLELPMRAVFGVGGSMSRKLAELEGRVDHLDSWDVARELRSGQLSNHPRVGMALAVQGIEYSSLAVTGYDVAVARELTVPISMHIGVQDGTRAAHGISQLDEAGLLGGDMQFVHCITTTDDEFRRLAELDARAACTPICELMIGFGLPPTDRMRRAGIAPAFGADAVCTASGDLFDEARAALIAERLNHAQRRFRDGTVDTLAHLGLTAREAIQGITTNAARACWLENSHGVIDPWKGCRHHLTSSDGPWARPTY